MTSIILLGPVRQIEEQLIPELIGRSSNDEYCSTEDRVVEVYRKVTIQPNRLNEHTHRLKPHEETCNGELYHRLPIQEHSRMSEDSSRMECDGGDSTDSSEPRMKRLKSLSTSSTSHTNDTDSGMNNEVQTPMERTVDVYILNMTNNEGLISTVTKSCIPNDGLIIVPKPMNLLGESEVKIINVLRGCLDDKTTKGNKNVPRLLVVDMQSERTCDDSSKDKLCQVIGIKQRHNCSLNTLRHTVCTLLSYFRQGDYICLGENDYDEVFNAESVFQDRQDQIDALLKENKVIRFKECNKNYICTCPEKLVALFNHATRHCKQWKEETTKMLIEMNMNGNKGVALSALTTLNFINMSDTNASHVCIKHLFRPERVDIKSLKLSRQSIALRFTTTDVVDMLKLLAICDLSGWHIKEAEPSKWNHDERIGLFLLSKDGLAVLLCSNYMYNETSIYMAFLCEEKSSETNDRDRNTLDALRRCVKLCIGSRMASFKYLHNESNTADMFIKDIVINKLGDWLDTNDVGLYYKKDVLALFRRWLRPSEEEKIEKVLHDTLDGVIISKLSAFFTGDASLFFPEQRLIGAAVEHAKINNPYDMKGRVRDLLIAWSNKKDNNGVSKGNLYTLRKAIQKSVHYPIQLTDFDDTVNEYLTGEGQPAKFDF